MELCLCVTDHSISYDCEGHTVEVALKSNLKFKLNLENHLHLYSVDLEVWSKPAKRARFKRIASKCAHNFDCDWQRVNIFSQFVTLTRVVLPQIISYSDTKVQVFVVMECKRASALCIRVGIFTPYFKVNSV